VPLAPGRVLLDPRVFAKLLDALNVGPRDLVLDLGCGLGYSTAVLARMAEAVVAIEPDAGMAAEAEALLGRHAVDNAVVIAGPLAGGRAEHGPFDAMILEGAIEVLPELLAGQLKPGGRIAAIVVDGSRGQARLGIRAGNGIAWRRIFDATAPVLPGFAATKAFEF
jgi:protein-L-isoaspartate(D-aspartate) O-methyltransferase